MQKLIVVNRERETSDLVIEKRGELSLVPMMMAGMVKVVVVVTVQLFVMDVASWGFPNLVCKDGGVGLNGL